ncbi:putative R3H domain-containing protein 2 [Apostichopus japonicus]|uniref:Putative R3H domain-containing protein 2 n=1 Tax=Stichopus japonicus TaxID=307972 RepID=A0A2G8KF09_STIJA|nr:putative R3H domain-containing protein 2 [Apostichopus japonicus]
MEELESVPEKRDKLVHSSRVISGEEAPKDVSSDESRTLPLPKDKTAESKKQDSGRFPKSSKRREKEPSTTAMTTTQSTGHDFVTKTHTNVESAAAKGDINKDSQGKHGAITKPKKKPPLFRTKVSEENLESSIPRLTRQASQEEPLPLENVVTRRRSNGRNKFLPRSQPVSDDTSPPPTPDIAIHIQQSDPPTVCRFPHQHSGDGPSLNPLFKQSSLEARSEPALSREPSQEKEFTDSKGVNLHQFIVDTLRKPQDRTMLLHLEKELADLVHSNASEKKFAPMSSYHRMIVHRVAAYFGLDHNVDQTGKAVIVNKTANTRIPEKKFKDHIHEDRLDGPARRILKRDTASYEDKDYYDQSEKSDMFAKDDKKSKSLRSARRGTTGSELGYSTNRPKAILQFNSRQSSGTSDDSSYHWKQDRPWSSVDSSGSDKPHIPVITKASSFAGTSISSNILMRDESGGSSRSSCSVASSSSNTKLQIQENPDGGSPHSTIPHCYHKVASPSSSSYSQPSQQPLINTDSTPCGQTVNVSWSGTIPSTAPPAGQFCMAPVIPGNQSGLQAQQQPVLFIAPNIESVPPGCIIVNPQSGQPYLNKDGSAMVYQPMAAIQHQPTHLTPGGISQQQQQQQQQQMVTQSCQHSSIPQYPQPITDNQLSNTQMMSYAPQQGQPPPYKWPSYRLWDFQELQGQFVNLTMLSQEGEGASHIQVQQMSSPQPQPGNQQVGMLAMKAQVPAVMKGSTHDLSQPYQTVQQNQQGIRILVSSYWGIYAKVKHKTELVGEGGRWGQKLHCRFDYDLYYCDSDYDLYYCDSDYDLYYCDSDYDIRPLQPSYTNDGHRTTASFPSSSQPPVLNATALPTSVQSQQMALHPSQGITPIYFSAAQEGQVADSQAKSQTMFTQGYPGAAATPSGSQSQIVYISEPQQYMEQPVPVFMSNSQSQLTSGQISSSSRDAIRPASPNAQTMPANYGLPPPFSAGGRSDLSSHGADTEVVIRNAPSPAITIRNPRSAPGGNELSDHTGSYARERSSRKPREALDSLTRYELAQSNPTAEAASRKELWRIPQAYPASMVQPFRNVFAEKGNEEVLEVSQLPRDLTCQAVFPLLEDILQFGAKIYLIPKSNLPTAQTPPSQVPSTKPVSEFTVLAFQTRNWPRKRYLIRPMQRTPCNSRERTFSRRLNSAAVLPSSRLEVSPFQFFTVSSLFFEIDASEI